MRWYEGLTLRLLSLQRNSLNCWQKFAPVVQNSFKKNVLLGFISFGGPAVHIQIFKRHFVEKHHWVEEPLFEELFGLTQSLSGPASTKLLYCINLHHSGTLMGIVAFFIWSLPGALGMYGLSLGIANIGETLPGPVYALLSGLNAAIVGVIALAAVQLSRKVISDQFTRALLFLGASAGLLYSALWYFPVLMFSAGVATIVWDNDWFNRQLKQILDSIRARFSSDAQSQSTPQREILPLEDLEHLNHQAVPSSTPNDTGKDEVRFIPQERSTSVSWRHGAIVIAVFLLSFIVFMVLRGTLQDKPLLFSLFCNMYLAGTIIFGGGSVVIPLLRDYVVTQGWISSRDFLLGLALIQAFPGPNFNFAVFLGSLVAHNASLSSAAGAVIGFVGIFAPGMILVHGTMGIWSTIRSRRWVKSGLRGINAAAVGLIFTAVYRLWEAGFVNKNFTGGSSLGRDPWWVVVAATAYVGSSRFSLPIPLAIVLGAVMGLIWYGVTYQSQA